MIVGISRMLVPGVRSLVGMPVRDSPHGAVRVRCRVYGRRFLGGHRRDYAIFGFAWVRDRVSQVWRHETGELVTDELQCRGGRAVAYSAARWVLLPLPMCCV